VRPINDAAGVWITDDEDRLLVVELVKKPYWVVPGGKAELGETPAACALREAREEIGVDVRLGDLVCVHHFFDYNVFVFTATLPPRAVITIQPEEIKAHAWLPVEEAASRMDAPNAAMTLAIADARGRCVYLEHGKPL
jgi:8-oxo-dGTP diphosphatase